MAIVNHHSPLFTLTHSPDSAHPNSSKPFTVHCKKKPDSPAPFEESKSGFVDYDRGQHEVYTRVSGLRKSDIPKRYRLRVESDRFQKDWTVSRVVEKVLELNHWEDVEGVLNRWVGRFARKNFPFLIKELTQRGAIEHSVQVFNWMKNQKNYCARNDIYNMMIRLHARHNRTDKARGLFFEMQEWRCKPNAETYNALINAHGRTGQWRWAMNIFDDMLRAAVCILIFLS
ncbi:hypothetical protein Pint_17868 [Pistacia integerrima]|uniref:Uncharacterized protein n=1 Tax=Pistacia integerrima TaxID=434235 RepID=A0ACC0Z0I2_9ROSI|nr:hypothetical protein Pint_17868 [Pistacia integerrima]